MAPALVFVHGRSQASDDGVARDPERLAAYVEARKRTWLGGLANGLIRAEQPPVDESAVLFPFYGNVFADAIKRFEKQGGSTPELDVLDADVKAAALMELAAALDFDPVRELGYSDPKAGELVAAEDRPGLAGLLRIPVLRAALQFLGRRTGIRPW